jgi:hypothetical protein
MATATHGKVKKMNNDGKKRKLEARIAELEAKQQLTPEEEAELEEKREQLEELEQEEPTVRVTLRLPAELHDEVRKIAKRDKLNLNDALVRRIEEGADSPRQSDGYQQLGDLIQACKLLDENQRPGLKRAIAERINGLYDLDLPVDGDGDHSDDAELRAQWEAYSKKKEPFKMYRRDGDPVSFADFAAFKRVTPAQRKQALQWRAVTDRDIEEAKKRLREESSRRVAAAR